MQSLIKLRVPLLIFITLILGYFFSHKKVLNILIADFYWETGIELYLRDNGTFKVINNDFFRDEVMYGEYIKKADTLILKESIRLGSSNIIDTLIYSKDGLLFRLDKDYYGLRKGRMIIRKNELFGDLDK